MHLRVPGHLEVNDITGPIFIRSDTTYFALMVYEDPVTKGVTVKQAIGAAELEALSCQVAKFSWENLTEGDQ